MNLGSPGLLAASAWAIAACTDLSDSGMTGRWAAQGLELRAYTFQSEVRMPCATVSSMPALEVDATGHFELSGIAKHSYGSFFLILEGQFARDTIHANLMALVQGAPPHTTQYTLVRNGDPAFERFACLG